MPHPFIEKTHRIKARLLGMKCPPKLVFFITGLLATLWFLVRVIPKPSRATYPCMRTAAPLMSSFVIYLLGLGGSVLSAQKGKARIQRARYLTGSALLLAALVLGTIAFVQNDTPSYGHTTDLVAPNEPVGLAQGIYPGRVVWIHDPAATNEQCTNYRNENGQIDANDDIWFQDKNTDQSVVDAMLAKGLKAVTGQSSLPEAWEQLFHYHNKKRYQAPAGYTPGEGILLKINRTSTYSSNHFTDDFSRTDWEEKAILSETSPQIVLSVLRQLVNQAGIPQQDIYVGDPMRNSYKGDYEQWFSEFQLVHYLGNNWLVFEGSLAGTGRTAVQKSANRTLHLSDNGEYVSEPDMEKLYQVHEDCKYLINLPMMKAHDAAGITLFAKNHFGSHINANAMPFHPSLPANEPGYGHYRPLVDIMGSNQLIQKSLVFILDALWTGSNWGDLPKKFAMPPFNDDWTSSLFVSLDPVAIESVAFDFLRTEFSDSYPTMEGTDDYLFQSADAAFWPAGIIYNPNGTGPMGSLGVHEYWNTALDKQYSRNLGTECGIELVDESGAALPIPPTITHMQLTNEQGLAIRWTDPSDKETGYVLEKQEASGDFTGLTTLAANSTQYTVPAATADAEAFYRIKATNSQGVTFSNKQRLADITGLPKANNLPPGLQLYPNPVNQRLHVQWDAAMPGLYQLQVHSTQGQLLLSRELSVQGAGICHIPVRDWPRGTYILTLHNGTQRISRRFVK